jgi:hypothetical protein
MGSEHNYLLPAENQQEKIGALRGQKVVDWVPESARHRCSGQA